MSDDAIRVYVETGETKTFATALDWPGWSRSGKDEAGALQTLFDYGPRYAQALEGTGLDFQPPSDIAAFVVAERVPGNMTTNFGAPNVDLSGDTEPVDAAELERWKAILQACWGAFDAAVEAAAGKTLRKGPRGGGRDLEKILEHVRDVDASYLSSLGGKVKFSKQGEIGQALAQIREAVLSSLGAAVRGEIPKEGPRGGTRWTPHYFVRRLAWHELDHAWEIEDRAE
jgi:hypothetical protein